MSTFHRGLRYVSGFIGGIYNSTTRDKYHNEIFGRSRKMNLITCFDRG